MANSRNLRSEAKTITDIRKCVARDVDCQYLGRFVPSLVSSGTLRSAVCEPIKSCDLVLEFFGNQALQDYRDIPVALYVSHTQREITDCR